jgi:hypothetical protein
MLSIKLDDRLVMARLDKFPETLKQTLRPKITELTNTLLEKVHAAEPARTGVLRASTRGFVDEGENFIRGRVRVTGDAPRIRVIAAALEYGGHKAEQVRSYLRRSGSVTGYLRRENIDAYRFLRGPFAVIRPQAVAAIEEAVNEAVQRTNV